ncbi:MAG TPA: thymidine phosphorylase [Terracidiphilus sp.]|nr:thymidine phosphorylase [Terracidiphilus sp.]
MRKHSATAKTGSDQPLHMIDLIRRKRDGGELDARALEFIAQGAARGTIPDEQLAAWLMASWIRGLTREETRTLTLAMRDSGEKLDASRLGKRAVDKHSTGGVGDKTSVLVAPLAAACGVAVPMISGRALGHTGGTLDKLESIPGYRTSLTLKQFERVIAGCGASIIGQTPKVVPADRVLYALRDRTGTVESPGLICASILSKKLAAGLHGLVLDVKTGSGAFLRDRQQAEFLAALMVATAEAAGTRTAALMTDMSQPLGRAAGNWMEVAECVELLRGELPDGTADLREVSLLLAGWMIHLGGRAKTPQSGYWAAAAALADGTGLRVFLEMVKAQGGNVRVFENLEGFHKPGATRVVEAWQSGTVGEMDTTMLGWAVQRTGAGREVAGKPVDPHAGIVFHAKRGEKVSKGKPLATIYATRKAMLDEPEQMVRQAIRIGRKPPEPVALISRVFTREEAEKFLRDAVR